MSRCIVSVATGERYRPYQARLLESLAKYAPGTPVLSWTDCFPVDSPTHREMHYAFKYHAVFQAVMQGFNQVLWLDAGCYAVADLAPIWKVLDNRGIYMVDGDEILGRWISDAALAWFGVTRDEAMDIRLCAGAIIGVDATKSHTWEFLREWKSLAKSGLFIASHAKEMPDKMKSLIVSDADESLVLSKDPRMRGHLSDEACLTLLMRKLKVPCVYILEWHKCFQSGYTLDDN